MSPMYNVFFILVYILLLIKKSKVIAPQLKLNHSKLNSKDQKKIIKKYTIGPHSTVFYIGVDNICSTVKISSHLDFDLIIC
jgi:hypothetical protein